MVHVGEERDVNEVVTLSRTVQYTDKQEEGAEGEVIVQDTPGVWRSKSSTQTVRNGVPDVNCNSSPGTGFRHVEPEEAINMERHERVSDVRWEERLYSPSVRFINSNLD